MPSNHVLSVLYALSSEFDRLSSWRREVVYKVLVHDTNIALRADVNIFFIYWILYIFYIEYFFYIDFFVLNIALCADVNIFFWWQILETDVHEPRGKKKHKSLPRESCTHYAYACFGTHLARARRACWSWYCLWRQKMCQDPTRWRSVCAWGRREAARRGENDKSRVRMSNQANYSSMTRI